MQRRHYENNHRTGFGRILKGRWRWGAAALASLSLLSAACGSSSSNAKAGGASTASTPIYVGAVLALTGPYAAIEVPNLQGLQAAVSIINQSGGLLGRKVDLVYKDDASDPTKAAAAAQTLFSQYKISFVEAEVIPALQLAILPYTNKLHIASIEPTIGPDLFDPTKNPYNFGLVPANGEVQGFLAGIKAISGTVSPKVAIINDNVSANVTLMSGVSSGATQAGVTIVSHQSLEATATDLSVQVEKAQLAGANVLLVDGETATCVGAAQAVQQLSWNSVKVLVDPGCVSSAVMTAVPSSVQSRFYALGQRAYLRATGADANAQAFLTALKANGDVSNLPISADSASCVDIAAYAIKEAGTTASASVLAKLQNFVNSPIPTGVLPGSVPSPRWSPTDHSFDSADVSNYYALLKAGTPIDGTYAGLPITISPAK